MQLPKESPQGLESQPFRGFRVGIPYALPAIIKRQFPSETAADFLGLQALETLLQVQVADEERAPVARFSCSASMPT